MSDAEAIDDREILTLPYRWAPRAYQQELWRQLEGGCRRAVAIWHRRAGKDLVAWNWLAREAFRRPGLYWHVLPTYRQARKVIWEGRTRDGRSFMSHVPDALVVRKRDDEMTLWLEAPVGHENGSMVQLIGSDQADSLVGANPFGVIFSEYALQDPKVWELVRPILAENGGWALFISTPRGRNHLHKLLEVAAKAPGWFCEVLSSDDRIPRGSLGIPDGVRFGYTDALTHEILDAERASGMSESFYLQEFCSSFNAPLDGAYYADQVLWLEQNNRVESVPWEPHRPVHTAWDLGVGDSTAIWFIQEIGREIHVIDYYEHSGKGIDHYAEILQKKPYVYGEHLVPHDAKAREFSSGGRSRIEVARIFGLRMRVVPIHAVDDGISAVRGLLPQCWFDETKTARGFRALAEYQKRWEPLHQVFSDNPLHNWASHAADAFRTYAMGRRTVREKRDGPLAPKLAIV